MNLTDEESRIMPVSGGGFEQSYNAQAGVDIDTMMVITAHVTQACNDKREVAPTLKQIAALPEELGAVQTLVADNGFFSQANPSEPQTKDPVVNMVHRLSTQAGKGLYKMRKQTVEPVFGIIKQVMGWRSMRGLAKAHGEWNLVTMAWNIKRMHILRAV